MQLNWNGVYVTTEVRGEIAPSGSRYRGPAFGDPWPLNPHSIERLGIQLTEREDGLVRRVWELTSPHQNPPDCLAPESPDVLPDLCLAGEYANLCGSRGISVRTLLCATPSPHPLLDGIDVEQSLLPQAKHLGYDYWDGGEISALWDIVLPELAKFADQLNDYGLFDELSLVHDYASARDRLVPVLQLEISTWMVADVWELTCAARTTVPTE